MAIRRVTAADLPRVHDILVATGVFSAEEVACADEMLADCAAASDDDGEYTGWVVEDGDVAGFACFGPTSFTAGTYDLYWIAVDPAAHGRGHGRRLLAAVEDHLRARGGRLVVVETSSRAEYGPTQAFYARCGYAEVARVPAFYRPGDDKLIFTREL